ncbi:MAG: pyruvate, phosphate dikinase [Myxococcales bacterium]|nr:pyruvate, phosphate dikinase [Myxococcales bacterium]
MTDKLVYLFSKDGAEGNRTMKALLGGKGANLAEMCTIGLPVPPGFTITTGANQHFEQYKEWPQGLDQEVERGIRHIEAALGARFGDPEHPLLVSVRSGAAISMPGMMDTVLNLGINDEVAEGLAKKTQNERFAYDAYRRFIDMFGDVVMGVHHDRFETVMAELKKERGVDLDVELDASDLRELVERYKAVYRKATGYMFPLDPREQLRFAIDAVFGSWGSERAVKYRQINKITGLLGTAVNVQAMVYGNTGDTSGTGVCFTRDPSTGENRLYGEFLVNAQGEDVVAGIRTPQPIDGMSVALPAAFKQLVEVTRQLETHYRNMQDIEFTVQDGELFMLQTRSGKRTGAAALKIAVDMVEEGLIDKAIASPRPRRAAATSISCSTHSFAASGDHGDKLLGRGLPASPGAAVGRVVFSADDAEAAFAKGEKVVLVRIETSPEDVGGMHAAQGILTSRGGMTSHAAVVARGWGKPCVAGCGDIIINYRTRSFTNGRITVKEWDWISIDGSTGEVVLGQRDLQPPTLSSDFQKFMGWVDELRTMRVRANADTPADAQKALEFGAEGIGLCRTEHMFFQEERILHMRQMILASNEIERRRALDKLLPYQRDDFKGIFRVMRERPVTIRLLDPPLHEFLPNTARDQEVVASSLGVSVEAIADAVGRLHETNPMMGHRGCRLGMTYPEITEMQTRAILEAAVELKREGIEVQPEIMVPLISTVEEIRVQKAIIDRVAKDVFKNSGMWIPYLVGTMIEIPRAALIADEIAKVAEFFSFGTNDLTQMTFGFSRDDSGKFLPLYVDRKWLPDDPFQSIDVSGVGALVRLGTERGRSGRTDLKVGVCGEHGGDPASVRFFFGAGLDYVSCSPFRVPIARLAAAQAQPGSST